MPNDREAPRLRLLSDVCVPAPPGDAPPKKVPPKDEPADGKGNPNKTERQ